MSYRTVVRAAISASAVGAVLFAAGFTGGAGLAATGVVPNRAAGPAKPAAVAPKAKSGSAAPKARASSAEKASTSAVAPSTTTRPPAVNAATTKKQAAAAAALISPAVVDVLARDADGSVAAGTGVVLTSTGEVVTNYHVISGASRVTAVDIGTGRTYPATVVGYVIAEDVAVLQLVGAANLPIAHLARTAAAPGQSVVAVGNGEGDGGAPARAAGTVTAGNRSVVATDEDGGSAETLTGMLQTTTPIVPGYSGGPLVNTAGEVVGVDTCGTFTKPGTPAVVAFAIPISTVMTAVHAVEALPAGRS